MILLTRGSWWTVLHSKCSNCGTGRCRFRFILEHSLAHRLAIVIFGGLCHLFHGLRVYILNFLTVSRMAFLDSFQVNRFLVRLAIIDWLTRAVGVFCLTLIAIDLIQEGALLVHRETVGRGALIVDWGSVTGWGLLTRSRKKEACRPRNLLHARVELCEDGFIILVL